VLPSVPKSFPSPPGEGSWLGGLAFQQAPARIAEWLTGALVAEWYAGAQRLPRLVTRAVTGPLCAAAALWSVRELLVHRAGWTSLAGHRFAVTDLLFDPAAGIAFGLLLVTCLAAERRGWPSSGALAWAGERSYSMYLVHAPIVGTTFALAGGVTGSAAGRVAIAVLAVCLSLGTAVLLYRYVEAPCAALSKRAGRTQSTQSTQGTQGTQGSPAQPAQPAQPVLALAGTTADVTSLRSSRRI
jgi:peptidoglycan/LPS O-acetylase OafA/YrhL